mmetsp:Transcript_175219/g.561952  ORF Transcript_175219/g.561952 Transcript_175219/m.561952 type:complete len:262 (-) Transcript_175219:994-1779(-)
MHGQCGKAVALRLVFGIRHRDVQVDNVGTLTLLRLTCHRECIGAQSQLSVVGPLRRVRLHKLRAAEHRLPGRRRARQKGGVLEGGGEHNARQHLVTLLRSHRTQADVLVQCKPEQILAVDARKSQAVQQDDEVFGRETCDDIHRRIRQRPLQQPVVVPSGHLAEAVCDERKVERRVPLDALAYPCGEGLPDATSDAQPAQGVSCHAARARAELVAGPREKSGDRLQEGHIANQQLGVGVQHDNQHVRVHAHETMGFTDLGA